MRQALSGEWHLSQPSGLVKQSVGSRLALQSEKSINNFCVASRSQMPTSGQPSTNGWPIVFAHESGEA
jgi:hypothetical protein